MDSTARSPLTILGKTDNTKSDFNIRRFIAWSYRDAIWSSDSRSIPMTDGFKRLCACAVVVEI